MINKSKKVNILLRRRSFLPGQEHIEPVQKIGASFTKTRPLTYEEENKYLVKIIDTRPSSDRWEKAVSDYWANIGKIVPVEGLLLETGFSYTDTKNASLGESANEENKHEFGKPLNIADYVLWRYCLVYGRVANTPQEQHKSEKIRFYMDSIDAKNAAARKITELRSQAMAKYLEIANDNKMLRNIVIGMRLLAPDNAKYKNVLEENLTVLCQDLAITKSKNFVIIANDKDLIYKAAIQNAVDAKIITQVPNTEIIQYGTETISTSIAELIAKFKTQADDPIISIVLTRLKLNDELSSNPPTVPAQLSLTDDGNIKAVKVKSTTGNEVLDKIKEDVVNDLPVVKEIIFDGTDTTKHSNKTAKKSFNPE